MLDTTTELDLSIVGDVLAYLSSTPFASDDAVALSGGFGNFAYRLRLCNPIQNHCTLILKHAKPYVAAVKTWPFPVERQVKYQTLTPVRDICH